METESPLTKNYTYGKCVDYIQLSFIGISREDALFICESCNLPPNDQVEDHALDIGEIVAMKLSDLVDIETSTITTVTRNEDESAMFDTYIPDPFLYKRKANECDVEHYYTLTSPAPVDFACGICQDDDTSKTTVCLNRCCHHYHKECVDTWLTTAKLTCPVCNAKLEDNADDDN